MLFLSFQFFYRNVRHRQLHPTGDVHPHGIRYNGVAGSQNTSDGEPVTYVRVRHKCSRNGDRQAAGVAHLTDTQLVETYPPLAIGGELGTLLKLRNVGFFEDGASRRSKNRILGMISGIGGNGPQSLDDLVLF